MGLKTYKAKRNFYKTPEPLSGKHKGKKLRFVIQRHNASHLHYDFRLELEHVLKSWAVPKGPSLNPNDKRLAVMVEDHPLDYGNFKGIIPKGNYGAGTVEIWDKGTYIPYIESKKNDEKELLNELEKGDLKFILNGKKIRGAFSLVRMNNDGGKNWLLIKKKDSFSTATNYNIEKITPLIGLTEKQKKSVPNKNSTALKTRVKPTVKKKDNEQILSFEKAVKELSLPMLAKYIDAPFDDNEWLYEYKWDGYRTIAAIKNGVVQLFSRNRLSQNARFVSIAKSLEKIKDTVIIDGEVVAEDKNGKHSFQQLQNFQRTGNGNLVYYIFDLLYLNGKKLISFELKDRKELLELLYKKYAIPNVKLSIYTTEKGIQFFNKAKRMGREGIMEKNCHSTYEPGRRSSNWLKVKAFLRQEAIICGYTMPQGSRKKFGSLILGLFKNGQLTYSGHCGTGFNEGLLNYIYKKLQPLKQKNCPFDRIPKTNEKPIWVKPKLICNIKFSEWTENNQFRIPVFLGLREDKKIKDVTMETPMKSGKLKENVSALKSKSLKDNLELKVSGQNLTLTHLNKIYWPKEKITKGELIDYYKSISNYILPYLKDRPQTLHRFPNGALQSGFYQKDVDVKKIPSWLKTQEVYSESNNKNINYLLCQDEATLLYMVNLGCIELNPWSSRKQKPNNPDWVVIDLDPGKNTFKQVVKVALVVKKVFNEIGVDCYCKTSGATGLHIFAPLGAKYQYDEVRKFAELIANIVNKRLPDITSIERSPAKRKSKIYIDFLQNSRGQTLAAPYSVRPRQGATVSTPLKWSEINDKLDPTTFTILNTLKRISKVGDLWSFVLNKGFNMKSALGILLRLK